MLVAEAQATMRGGVLREAVGARRWCESVGRQGSAVGATTHVPLLETDPGLMGAAAQVKFVKTEDVAKATSGFGKYTLLDIRPEVDFCAVRPLTNVTNDAPPVPSSS